MGWYLLDFHRPNETNDDGQMSEKWTLLGSSKSTRLIKETLVEPLTPRECRDRKGARHLKYRRLKMKNDYHSYTVDYFKTLGEVNWVRTDEIKQYINIEIQDDKMYGDLCGHNGIPVHPMEREEVEVHLIVSYGNRVPDTSFLIS
jgi:hypothetical protein